jgi:stage V sporulation protein D (sporulation-specific penicillin-binding protein)
MNDDETPRDKSRETKRKKTEKNTRKTWGKPQTEYSKTSLDLRKNAVLAAMMAAFIILVGVLYSLMVIDEDGLSQKASEQYTREITLAAKRGTIYDRNMNVLAVDYTVYTVFISPRAIKNDVYLNLMADGLVEILEVDRQMIEERASKKSSAYQVIAKDVSEEKAGEIRAYIAKILARTRSYENPTGIDLSSIINLTEETKRYYPYGSLAANLIGFVSGTSQSTNLVGICGAEATYENVLKGVNGKIVRAADGKGDDIAYKYETYIEAKDGQNIVLSIDITVQAMLEKYLEEAYYDNNNPTNDVACVIMDVNTGEVLASAKFPSFDLNEPRKLNAINQAKFDKLPESEQTEEKKLQMCMEQWSDKVAMETYEPGSTFKIITAAVALEEGVADLNDSFTCTSAPVIVGGWPIHCHKYGGHGPQSFGQTLQNSCNPAFIKWGEKIGKTKFVEYFDSFGYTDKS